MKSIIILIIVLALAGCASSEDPATIYIKVPEVKVIAPDTSLFVCPKISKLPDTKTLTDIQVSRVMLDIYQTAAKCRNSLNAVKKSIDDDKKTFGSNATD